MIKKHINLILLPVWIALFLMTSGCAHHGNEQLPVLSQDELVRPYIKLGRIQVTREVYLADYGLMPDINAWGLAAVRQEADKMGADAIMLFEVTGKTTTYTILPSSEYRASGFAIKFK